MSQAAIQNAIETALQHHRAGRLQQAEQLYRQVLAHDPKHFVAMHYLGVIADQSGRRDVAIDLMRRAVALNPNYIEAHVNLGNSLKDSGQIDEAIASFNRALALNPNLAEARLNLGNALNDKGEFDEATAAFRSAIALKPDFAEAHYNLGNILKNRGKLDEAEDAIRRAIALKPNFPEGYLTLGNIRKDQGQLDEAIVAFRRAIPIWPGFADAYNALGIALAEKGDLDEAVRVLRHAIALRPDYADAHSNLGMALKNRGELDDAIAAFRRALALKPEYHEAQDNIVLALHYHPGYGARAIADEQANWNRRYAEPVRQYITAHANDRSPDRRLRIGYVSADLRDHPVGRHLLPILANHDRHNFEVFAYASASFGDDMNQRLRSHADAWRDIVGLSDAQAADLIRQDQIDILVDLSLHTANNRLLVFARKPAPVQVTWLGYPASTGLRTIDYRLSDPHMDPPGMDESIYSERTIRLPDSFWCYDPLDARQVPVNPLPAIEPGVVTFGCLNNFCKVNEPVLKLWAQVLRAAQGTRLLMLSPDGSCRQRILDVMSKQGIDPARVEFISRQSRTSYLESYHRIDIFLDTFPYNGHSTGLDSLWMGVPVVTLMGQTAVSRAGFSHLSNLGLTELAADSHERYVTIALDLANDLPRLRELRSTLRQRMEASPLTDAPTFVRNIEAAYRRMWQSWCAADVSKT